MRFTTATAAIMGLVGGSLAITIGGWLGQQDEVVAVEIPSGAMTGVDSAELVEFFWLRCPHCFEAEPSLTALLHRRPDIRFARVAAMLNQKWSDDARLYFALVQIGHGSGPVFEKVFAAMQQDPAKPVEAIAAVLGNERLVRKLENAMRSKETEARMHSAKILSGHIRLKGVPAFLVRGAEGYTVVYASDFQSYDALMMALERAVDRGRKRAKH